MPTGDNHPRPVDYLAELARRQPDEPAVIDDRPDGSITRLSWADFNAYVNRIANGFLALGLEPLDKLAWCGKNSLETLAITHVARKIGAISVPLNYRLTAEEMAYLLEDSDAVAAWVDADLALLFAEIREDRFRQGPQARAPSPSRRHRERCVEGYGLRAHRRCAQSPRPASRPGGSRLRFAANPFMTAVMLSDDNGMQRFAPEPDRRRKTRG